MNTIYFKIEKKLFSKTASSYFANVLVSKTYSCALTSTCPSYSMVSGTGFTYECCFTSYCNTAAGYSTMRQAATSSYGLFVAAVFIAFAKLN